MFHLNLNPISVKEPIMTLAHRLVEYISACFTGLWVTSHEHEDALTEIAGLCREQNWKPAVWDIASGLVYRFPVPALPTLAAAIRFDRGCPERRARGGHGSGIGRAASIVGFRALPGCREQRGVPGQRDGEA